MINISKLYDLLLYVYGIRIIKVCTHVKKKISFYFANLQKKIQRRLTFPIRIQLTLGFT